MELSTFLGQPLSIALPQIRALSQLEVTVKETAYGNKNLDKGEAIVVRVKKIGETIELLVSYF